MSEMRINKRLKSILEGKHHECLNMVFLLVVAPIDPDTESVQKVSITVVHVKCQGSFLIEMRIGTMEICGLTNC